VATEPSARVTINEKLVPTVKELESAANSGAHCPLPIRTDPTILVKEAVTRENAVNLLDPGGRN